MILRDVDIRTFATEGMILPFDPKRLNSYGYDLTLAEEFLIPREDMENPVVDPFNPPEFEKRTASAFIIIPPNSFILGRSVERMKMPRDVTGICLGRSTYARAGVISHVTPLEAGWEGTVTIEISNTNRLPVKVRVGEGITQVLFFRGDLPPERDYVAKGGRYQGQIGVTQGRE